MTLYNIIRDFFVRYVFGGFTSYGQEVIADNYIGRLYTELSGSDDFNTVTLGFPLGNTYDDLIGDIGYAYIGIGDWLSTTATIITLVALFVGIALLTIKLFKIVSNIIALR